MEEAAVRRWMRHVSSPVPLLLLSSLVPLSFTPPLQLLLLLA